MSTAGHIRKRKRIHDIIIREGQTAVLRGADMDNRTCHVMEDAFSPSEIDGVLIRTTDRRFFMSALAVTDSGEAVAISRSPDSNDRLIIADHEMDSNVTEFIMASQPVRVCPGTVVVHYELHCREP